MVLVRGAREGEGNGGEGMACDALCKIVYIYIYIYIFLNFFCLDISVRCTFVTSHQEYT